MELEDHLGDVVRKARNASGVPMADAALAAGIPTDAWLSLEQNGRTDRPVRWQAVAPILNLNGPKLQGLAQGWRPRPGNLGVWHELRQINTSRGGNAVNCFLVWDTASREAALFDTGWDATPVFEAIDTNGLQLQHLFLTHSHEDHIAALEPLQRRFPDLQLHTGDARAPATRRNRPGECIGLGSLRITHQAVPGHADDGVIYLVGNWPGGAPQAAIVGDTLFAGSLARGFVSTDLLKRNVREHILSLPPETLLCPGHGPVSTVGEEQDHNPFF